MTENRERDGSPLNEAAPGWQAGGGERGPGAGAPSPQPHYTTGAQAPQSPETRARAKAAFLATIQDLAQRAQLQQQLDAWDMAQLAPQQDGWQFLTLADAYKPRPPLVYLVQGLIELPSLVCPYGAPGSLKSMLFADLAICVAAGLPWLSSLAGQPTARATTQAPVVWLDFDNGARRTAERFDAMGKARKLPPDTPLYYVSMPMPWLDAGDPDQINKLIARIKERDAQLVCIDNLALISGRRDENANAMVEVTAGLRFLSEHTGAAVMPIHHQRKGSAQGGGRAGDAMRGFGGIEAAFDLALQVTREPGSNLAEVKSTKERGAEVPPFAAYFTYTHKLDAHGQDTNELETALFYGQKVDDTSSERAIEQAILDILQGSPERMKQGALVEAVREELPQPAGRKPLGINRISEAAKRMAASGKISVKTGDNNARLYGTAGQGG